MEYEIDQHKPAAIDQQDDNEAGWTLMGANGKPVCPPPTTPKPTPVVSPQYTPTPNVPIAVSVSPPNNPTPPRAATHPPQPARPVAPYVSHNDGTLRITVKWNPTDYFSMQPTIK